MTNRVKPALANDQPRPATPTVTTINSGLMTDKFRDGYAVGKPRETKINPAYLADAMFRRNVGKR